MAEEKVIDKGVTLTTGGPVGTSAGEAKPAAAASTAEPPLVARDRTEWIQLSPTLKVRVAEPNGNIVFRAARILPADLAANPIMLNMVQSMLYIAEIQEGDTQALAQPPLQSFLGAEALANKVGDEGLMILQAALSQLYPVSEFARKQMKAFAADPNS